jgi:multiple antibiotic resistance protein
MWWFGDFVNDFLAIWVVLDPTAALPIFIAMTAGYDAVKRRRVAGAAVLVALAILVFFIVLGQIVINAIGVSLHAFQIAGGIILFLFAVELVIGQDRVPVAETGARASPLQLAVYPLAVPTIAGPGSMMTVMLRTDNSRVSLLEQIHTSVAVLCVLALTYVLLVCAEPVARVLGIGGANIVKRVMGMILAAYAVTLVLQGLATWLKLPPI